MELVVVMAAVGAMATAEEAMDVEGVMGVAVEEVTGVAAMVTAEGATGSAAAVGHLLGRQARQTPTCWECPLVVVCRVGASNDPSLPRGDHRSSLSEYANRCSSMVRGQLVCHSHGSPC